jgi:glycosyltransferase involved in cell wall biosynthesis
MGERMKHTADFLVSSKAAAPHSLVSALPPRIAINGRFLTQNFSGVQRFASETIKAIDALLDSDAYRAFRGRIEIVAPSKARDFPLKNIPLRRCGWSNGYLWEQVEFPLHAAGALLLNLCMLGPVAVRRQVVVVHDATVKALPGNFSWRFRTAYGILIPLLCRRAALAVTVSEFSRREIGKLYGVDTGSMPVCSEGGDHIIAVPADESVIERLGLAGRKFLISVGANSSNKNIEVLVAAFGQAKLSNTLLVLTGKRDPAVFGKLKYFNSNAVKNVGHVNDSELRALYEHALALVFPSRYEGFGLPPIEAMSCGCPVITSDQPALIEVGGDAALRCGMDDVAGLAQLMREVDGRPELRAKLAAAGRARASQFTWAATARRLLDHCIEVG